jgi:uncharacterized integral membrane protein (TIGR00698 family)
LLSKTLFSKILFFIFLLFCVSPYASPPLALALGLALALSVGNSYKTYTSKASKLILQISVVGLGFKMNIATVMTMGIDSFWLTFISIFGILLLGIGTGKLLKVQEKTSYLIASGTAICGGSAIAAIAPVVDAKEEEISVSLAVVFILNAIALFIFPIVGKYLELSQNQFGIWAALAIHDTSSVVGASKQFGEKSLEIATTIKLTRALWIIPVAITSAYIFRKKDTKIQFPYFILYFLLASCLYSYIEILKPIAEIIANFAHIGLTITLFLIGAGLSADSIKKVGMMPFLQAVSMWLVVTGVILTYVMLFQQ